jgi:hypothetical protein
LSSIVRLLKEVTKDELSGRVALVRKGCGFIKGHIRKSTLERSSGRWDDNIEIRM